MGKKYNNYSNKFVANKEEVVETTTLEQQPENDVEVENTQPESIQAEVETPVEPVVEELPTPKMEVKTGVVTGCEKLNVRKGPSKETEPVAVIDKGYEMTIEEELPDWYKVKIAGGIIGYCMAEFIAIP